MKFIKTLAKKIVPRQQNWSIGIYTGSSPFTLDSPSQITNPVLTANDVTDIPAKFIADPFMVHENGIWYMFFEVLDAIKDRGSIALATSEDGFSWNYKKVVLSETFHLSYPYVFKWNDEFYMIPETFESRSIRLYKATDFPDQWIYMKTLINGYDFVDSSIFYFHEKWWIFSSCTANNILRLYYSPDLLGSWREHPKSPLIQNNLHIARPGGRVITYKDQLIRYAQDDYKAYGHQVHAFLISELTTENYEEELAKSSVIGASGSGWNRTGMHTIDCHQINEDFYLACVDGYYRSLLFNSGFEINY